MAYTTPRTYVAGEVHTAAHHNTYERDNIAWLATDSPSCRAYNNANISHAVSTAAQAVTLNSERFDNAAVHSTGASTSRFTIPSGGGGKYVCTGALSWAPSAAGSYRQIQFRLTAATIVGSNNNAPSASHGSDSTLTAVYAAAAADYFELFGNQDSGGALNMMSVANYSPEASIFWFRT